MNTLSIAIVALIIIIVALGIFQNRRSVAGGIHRDREEALSPCPTSSNCVSTYLGSGYASLKPMQYEGIDRDTAREILQSVLRSWPRCEIVTVEDDYMHAVMWSRIFRFRDDLEFHLPDSESVVNFRAASRVGHDDFGIHRRRMHHITTTFEEAARKKSAGE